MPHLSGSFTGIGTRPTLVSTALISAAVLELIFSEPMEATGLGDTATYTIDGGVTVAQAEIVPGSNNTKVRLTIANFSANTAYNVTVSPTLTDEAGNLILPG
jgi:hypothetical protein